MTQLELDPQFIQCLRLLHSTNKDSVDQLRSILDEVIRQKHGSSKMLSNVLHKKYVVEEPVLSDHSSSGGGGGSGSSGKKSKSSSSSAKHSSKSSKSNSPEVVQPAHEAASDILQSDDTLAMEILEDDLTCVMCKGMDVGARNRLVECVECHSLYHQECHLPHIPDSQIDVPRLVWYCSKCSKTNQVPKETSSPKTVMPETKETKTKESKKSGKKQGSKSQKSSSKKQK